jgi:hypothetical protein
MSDAIILHVSFRRYLFVHNPAVRKMTALKPWPQGQAPHRSFPLASLYRTFPLASPYRQFPRPYLAPNCSAPYLFIEARRLSFVARLDLID